ncbi:MAG: hypothetical protein ACLP7W_02015 [Solirubrobacteraceae bacterium]|jgi:hypothetical protein
MDYRMILNSRSAGWPYIEVDPEAPGVLVQAYETQKPKRLGQEAAGEIAAWVQHKGWALSEAPVRLEPIGE